MARTLGATGALLEQDALRGIARLRFGADVFRTAAHSAYWLPLAALRLPAPAPPPPRSAAAQHDAAGIVAEAELQEAIRRSLAQLRIAPPRRRNGSAEDADGGAALQEAIVRSLCKGVAVEAAAAPPMRVSAVCAAAEARAAAASQRTARPLGLHNNRAPEPAGVPTYKLPLTGSVCDTSFLLHSGYVARVAARVA
jgi:hypothetical protein